MTGGREEEEGRQGAGAREGGRGRSDPGQHGKIFELKSIQMYASCVIGHRSIDDQDTYTQSGGCSCCTLN